MPEHSTGWITRARARSSRPALVALAVVGLSASLVGCAGESEAPAAPTSSDVGKAFTSDEGIEVSVTQRICGISGVGEDKPEFTAVGQYCTVGVNIENGSEEPLDLTLLKVKGMASDTEYFPDHWAGAAADGGVTELDAGDTEESTLFFDIPKGDVLDVVELTSPWGGIESFTVTF